MVIISELVEDDEYELVKGWLESDDEEVNLHAIQFLQEYYDNNIEPKEDRIVDLLLMQLDKEITPFGFTKSDHLRFFSLDMLDLGTRPYEGRIVDEIVRVAIEDKSESMRLAAIKTLGSYCHPSSVSFLIENCNDSDGEMAERSIWSLNKIHDSKFSTHIVSHPESPFWTRECIRDCISRNILKVAEFADDRFKVKESCLYFLKDYPMTANLHRRRSDEGIPPRFIDVTPQIIRLLEQMLRNPFPGEPEEIKSLKELALKWNKGEMVPFQEITSSDLSQQLPSTEEEWKTFLTRYSKWVERHFPELNIDEQYEQLVPCIVSAKRYMDVQFHRVIEIGVRGPLDYYWIDKDGGPEGFKEYL